MRDKRKKSSIVYVEEKGHLWCARPQLFREDNWTTLCSMLLQQWAWDRCSSGMKRQSGEPGTGAPLGQSSSPGGTPQPRPCSPLAPGVHCGKGPQQKACSARTLLEDIILRKKPDWNKIKGNQLQGPSSSRGGEGYSKSEKNQPQTQLACWLLPAGTLPWASPIWIHQNSALARATLVIQLDLNWNIWCLLICSNKFTRSWLCAGN